MPRLIFLTCFLSITFASAIWATEFNRQWRGLGTTKEERPAQWSCSDKFGLEFAIVGNKTTGIMKGSVNSRGRIRAKAGDFTPITFKGAISGTSAQVEAEQTWRNFGDGCSGTSQAWRLIPIQTVFPEENSGSAIRSVVFTTGFEGDDLADNLSEISIDSHRVYVLVLWKFDLENIENFKVQYKMYDGKGNIVVEKLDYLVPKTSAWHTWLPIEINKDRHEPGDWKFVVYFNDQKAVETVLNVHSG